MLEDKGGAYIEINNLDDMEEKIESLRDKKLRENISKWNIKKVKECYCRDKVVEHIFQEYEKVINWYNKFIFFMKTIKGETLWI